jgi:hypothetical protein
MAKPTKYRLTESLTTNKANWSGEQITVKVDREKLVWEQYGYLFWLEFKAWPEDLQAVLGKGRYEIKGDSWAADYVLGTIDEHGANYEATSMDMTRDAKDPIVAAVQLICNTV